MPFPEAVGEPRACRVALGRAALPTGSTRPPPPLWDPGSSAAPPPREIGTAPPEPRGPVAARRLWKAAPLPTPPSRAGCRTPLPTRAERSPAGLDRRDRAVRPESTSAPTTDRQSAPFDELTRPTLPAPAHERSQPRLRELQRFSVRASPTSMVMSKFATSGLPVSRCGFVSWTEPELR